MRLLRDRFLISVAIITAIIILGLFILHRWAEKKIQPYIASKSALSTPVRPEVKSLPSVVQLLPSRGPFRAKHVLDGDTLELDNGERVRLIGVDAP
jgi:hypothetical protein